jgi:Tfp pilus assembly protein PilO
MKDILTKNIHMFLILYTAYNIFTIYEEKSLLVENKTSNLAGSERKLKKSKKELAKIDQFNKDLEASRERVKEVVKEIKKVQRQLPSEINDTEVQGILTDISNDLKMSGPETKPLEEIAHGFYYSKEYIFDAKGTFLQYLIFYEKLENLSKAGRILNVKYLRISQDKNSDKRSRFRTLRLTTNVESFRYNPNYKAAP